MLELVQGEVWDIDFGEPKLRPGVVVTRTQLNYGQTILVVPCSGSQVDERSTYPNQVLLRAGTAGLSCDYVAQTHLILPVAREYFRERQGRLSDEGLGEILHALAWTVDLYGVSSL